MSIGYFSLLGSTRFTPPLSTSSALVYVIHIILIKIVVKRSNALCLAFVRQTIFHIRYIALLGRCSFIVRRARSSFDWISLKIFFYMRNELIVRHCVFVHILRMRACEWRSRPKQASLRNRSLSTSERT